PARSGRRRLRRDSARVEDADPPFLKVVATPSPRPLRARRPIPKSRPRLWRASVTKLQASGRLATGWTMGLQGDFYQVGVVVRDVEAGMARYRALLGLGPFMRLETCYRARYRDWTGEIANRNAFAR